MRIDPDVRGDRRNGNSAIRQFCQEAIRQFCQEARRPGGNSAILPGGKAAILPFGNSARRPGGNSARRPGDSASASAAASAAASASASAASASASAAAASAVWRQFRGEATLQPKVKHTRPVCSVPTSIPEAALANSPTIPVETLTNSSLASDPPSSVPSRV